MYIKSLLKNERGFTLTELLVVAAIIGILVSIATPIFINSTNNAKLKTCFANLRTLDGAIQNYGSEQQVNPTALADLFPLYVKEIPSEPFGGTYTFVPAVTNISAAHVACDMGHSY